MASWSLQSLDPGAPRRAAAPVRREALLALLEKDVEGLLAECKYL